MDILSSLKNHNRIVRDYDNDKQYSQIDFYQSDVFAKKQKFLDELTYGASKVSSYSLENSFLDEFYLLNLNINKYKANKAYIYKNDDNTYSCDLISEWKDKQKNKIIRNIKHTEKGSFMFIKCFLKGM